MSTFAAIDPVKEVQRWDRKLMQNITVSCPSIIVLYNSFMGGVDLLDALLALYRNPIRSKKWYHRLLFHIFDLAVVQSWVLYVKDCEHERIPKASMLSLLQFKLNIAECMLKENKSLQKKKRAPIFGGRTSTPDQEKEGSCRCSSPSSSPFGQLCSLALSR